jgi:glycosyltransferase involved in cell wall biosynthesis
MDERVRISLVVPARNEAQLLPRLLASVAVARSRYRPGEVAIEIIVADNGSSDETCAIARAAGCIVVDVQPRIIAAVRNGGAAVARGDLLAFVDADMQVHPDTFDAVDAALSDPLIAGGASGIRPERWSLGIGAVYALTDIVGRATGIEAGLAYLRREDFEVLHGYDERRAALEDVDLLWRLRRLGRARGQRLARLRATPAIFSTRKFDLRGDWHWLALGARMMASRGWRTRRRTAVVERYWYDPH